MLTSLLCLLLCSDPSTFLSLDAFEGTTAADGQAAEWSPLTIGAGGESAPAWSHVRTSFDLGAAPADGRWLLRIGPAGLQLTAHLNGQVLLPMPDPAGAREEVRVGAMFAVPHTTLRESGNQLELTLRGEDRRLESGPAYLLSPDLAERFLTLVRADLAFPVANLSTLSSVGADGRMAARVLFRDTEGDGALRLAAHLDLTLDWEGREVDPTTFAVCKVNQRFPVATLIGQDPLDAQLMLRHFNCAPLGVEPERMERAKFVLGEIGNQRATAGGFEFTYHLRLFPARGGALRFEQSDDLLLLHNGEVALFAAGAKLLGEPDRPLGLSLTLKEGGAAGKSGSLAGPSLHYGLFAFDGVLQTKRLTTPLETALYLVKEARDLRIGTGSWGNRQQTVPDLPDETPLNPALSRIAAYATANLGRYLPGPRSQDAAPPVDQFWGSEALLPQELAREQEVIDRSLDAGGEGESAEQRSDRRLYAVLRALRAYRHDLDGERLAGRAAALIEAVEEEPPDGIGRAMARHAAVAGLRPALEAVGRDTDAVRLGALEQSLAQHLYGASGVLGPATAEAPPTPAATRALCEAFLLDAVPAEAREAALGWLLPAARGSSDGLTRVLGLWMAYRTGLVEGWETVLRQEAERVTRAAWLEDDMVALHGALVHGYGGVRFTGPASLEVLPRADFSQVIRLLVPLGDGTLSINVGKPDRQLLRLLQVSNKTSDRVQLRIGIPGKIGTGEKVRVGDLDFSLYDFEIEPGKGERLQVR